MINIFKHLKRNIANKSKKVNRSKKEAQEALSHPGIIGLTAIWDVYDMWI